MYYDVEVIGVPSSYCGTFSGLVLNWRWDDIPSLLLFFDVVLACISCTRHTSIQTPRHVVLDHLTLVSHNQGQLAEWTL